MKNLKLHLLAETFQNKKHLLSELDSKMTYKTNVLLALQEDQKFEDHSIYFEDADGILILPITISNKVLSFLNLGITPIIAGNPNVNYETITNKIEQLGRETGSVKIKISDEFYKKLKFHDKTKHFCSAVLIAKIDLKLNESEIYSAISKGHKSSIKSGQKILSPQLFNYKNFSSDKLDQLIALYQQIAKKNKSEKFWHFVKKAILENEAFFVLSTYENKPVSCQLFFNGANNILYALAAYDRDLMAQSFSLSHWPLFFCIIESKKYNYDSFEIGYLYENEPDEKIKSIFKFKSNFTNKLVTEKVWEISSDII